MSTTATTTPSTYATVVLRSDDGVVTTFTDAETALQRRSAVIFNILEDAEDSMNDGTLNSALDVPITNETLVLVHEFLCKSLVNDTAEFDEDDTIALDNGPDTHRENNWQWRRHARIEPPWRREFCRRHFCTNGDSLPDVVVKWTTKTTDASREKARQSVESDRVWAIATIARKAAAHPPTTPPAWMSAMAAQPVYVAGAPVVVPIIDDARRQSLLHFLRACRFLDLRRASRAVRMWIGRDVFLPSTPEQIRAFMGIENDGFTEAERAKILEENNMVIDDDDDS